MVWTVTGICLWAPYCNLLYGLIFVWDGREDHDGNMPLSIAM